MVKSLQFIEDTLSPENKNYYDNNNEVFFVKHCWPKYSKNAQAMQLNVIVKHYLVLFVKELSKV